MNALVGPGDHRSGLVYVSVADQFSDNHSTEPSTLKEALSSNQSKEWKVAADAEYQSLMENDTWELVKLPAGRTAIGCKWVFKTKHRSDGSIDRFKGRVVAKGYA